MGLRLRLRLLVLVLATLAAVPAWSRPRPILHGERTPPVDVFSDAELDAVRITHTTLDLEVDFDAQQLRGSVRHRITNLSGTDRLALDTRGLVIHAVRADGEDAEWTMVEAPRNGGTLVVRIDASTREVEIDYETTVTNSGLVFMTPEQTVADTDPFLYTFGQADKTRDWIPIQDTPGVRMTWDATVRVPEGLLALMSAPDNPTEASPDGVYSFEMPYPMPPYLIALAVGRVEFHALDERTGFYAEAPFVDDAKWELAYIPAMLDVAERLFGPYPFDRYDVLLAPPGYAAGGMENPMLNFLNVLGAITSDREESPRPSYLVAHELAHSWAGDLATCATWNDTWINEGFATYYGHRILGEMLGTEQAELGFYFERDAFETYDDAVVDRDQTRLHREFERDDKLAIFSPASYSKGGIFLQMLDTRMGRASFDGLILRWFGRHRYRWVDDLAFVAELRRTPGTDLQALRIDEWIYGTGLPSNVTAPTRSAIWDRVARQADRFRSGVPASSLNTTGWTNQEIDFFLWQVTEDIRFRMAELDAAFDLSSRRSPSTHWFGGVARTLYAPGLPMMERYLMLGGFNVVFIYDTLSKSSAGRAYALAIYERARPHYVPAIRFSVDRILNLDSVGVRPAA